MTHFASFLTRAIVKSRIIRHSLADRTSTRCASLRLERHFDKKGMFLAMARERMSPMRNRSCEMGHKCVHFLPSFSPSCEDKNNSFACFSPEGFHLYRPKTSPRGTPRANASRRANWAMWARLPLGRCFEKTPENKAFLSFDLILTL